MNIPKLLIVLVKYFLWLLLIEWVIGYYDLLKPWYEQHLFVWALLYLPALIGLDSLLVIIMGKAIKK